jgi:hypothetical protein
MRQTVRLPEFKKERGQWNKSGQVTNTSEHYKLFLKMNVSCVKKVKSYVKFCECTKQDILN